MSRGPKWYKTAIDQDRLWNTIKQPFHIKQKDQESNPKYQTYNNDNNNNDDFNNNNVFYNTWAFEGWNQRWRTTATQTHCHMDVPMS